MRALADDARSIITFAATVSAAVGVGVNRSGDRLLENRFD